MIFIDKNHKILKITDSPTRNIAIYNKRRKELVAKQKT